MDIDTSAYKDIKAKIDSESNPDAFKATVSVTAIIQGLLRDKEISKAITKLSKE